MKLETGYNYPFEIRKYNYEFPSMGSFSVLYLSDFHFTKYSDDTSIRTYKTIESLNPSIILLGGDYADTKKGLQFFEEFLKKIAGRKVFAVAGNHDYFFGIERIKAAMLANNIIWIEKSTAFVSINNQQIKIDGNFIDDNMNNQFSILCLHKPVNPARVVNYNLVFAGHLHGTQIVLWQTPAGLFPGKFFYKWNFLEKKNKNCFYFISKGLGDTLPIRYNCKKDVVLINVV